MERIEDLRQTSGPRPNGLQAAPDGLWVIDAENSHITHRPQIQVK